MEDSASPSGPILAALRAMPGYLRDVSLRVSHEAALTSGPGGGLSFLEQVWHLADLEVEGYGLRIDRILNEETPKLADFDGGRIAREREYRSRKLAEGLARFAEARERNVAILAAVTPSQWERTATQEGVGSLRLSDVPRMMAEHDASHRNEIRALLGDASPESGSTRVA